METIRMSAAALVIILISVETVESARDGTSPSISKKGKFKRDSSNGVSYSTSFLDNGNFAGSHQYYLGFKPVTPGRGHEQTFAPLFSFPKGTKIMLTPSITVPVSADLSEDTDIDIRTSVEASFPITIQFKEVKSKVFHTDFLHDKVSLMGSPTSYENHPHLHHNPSESNEIDQQQRLHSRKLRDVGSSTNDSYNDMQQKNGSFVRSDRRCPFKSFSDRRGLLQKMELFVSNVIGSKDNAKSCLLRWACEMHANSDVAAYYGLIGEGALLVFSVEQLSRSCDSGSPHLKYLLPFIKAEVAGKSGSCFKYGKKCSQSLFMM